VVACRGEWIGVTPAADPGQQIASGAAKEVHDMNWKQRVLEAAAGVVLIALPAHAQVSPTIREERIVSFIHQANLQEIEAAKLAKAKSSSQDVKDFADQMISDHESADEQVRSYAQQHKIDLDGLSRHLKNVDDQRLEQERRSRAVGTATGEWAFTWENENVAKGEDDKSLARLRRLDGAAFDREFASAMVTGHQKVVDGLTDARNRRIDPDLRKLIDSLLPTVKHHLEMAQALQGVVSKS
jgi:putative membrane protein